MLEDKLRNINIARERKLPAPKKMAEDVPTDDAIDSVIYHGRQQIMGILDGKDNRLIMIVGPCSIHDVKQGKAYAQALKPIAEKVKDKMLVVMRTYFEKPRTTVGWPGMAYDPDLNDSGGMEKGLRLTRGLLCDIANIGLLTAAEFAGVLTPQYYGDLVSYAAIGARTSESRDHRGMASGLSMPAGLKNGTSGSLKQAIDAVVTARSPQIFLGITYEEGLPAEINTKGNPYTHAILRGGETGPNYDEESVKKALELEAKAGLDTGIIIDASHANSGKDPHKQPAIVYDIVQQRIDGNHKIAGIMVESNLKEGESKTDQGLPWQETEKMILKAYDMLK